MLERGMRTDYAMRNISNIATGEDDRDGKYCRKSNCDKLCLRPDAFGLRAFVAACDLDVEVGDLVQIDRVLYTDWALYVGDGSVVHVCGLDIGENEIPTDFARVKRSSLAEVAGYGGVRVNNKVVGAKERNLEPLPVEQVIEHVHSLLDNVVEFNMLTRNSEHYVTEWKYGQGWSDQAMVAMNVMRTLSSDSTVGHSVLVNSLNEVLNSPGSPLGRSPPKFTSVVNKENAKT